MQWPLSKAWFIKKKIVSHFKTIANNWNIQKIVIFLHTDLEVNRHYSKLFMVIVFKLLLKFKQLTFPPSSLKSEMHTLRRSEEERQEVE